MNDTYLYEYKNSLYVNLTNKCTNSCDFCIRNQMDGVEGYDLWLKKDPKAFDIIEKLKERNLKEYKEIIFCGYGEPTIKLDVLLEVAEYIKKNHPKTIIRINTNGQTNLYHKKDVTPLFESLIDKLSISLNAPDAKQYQAICHSRFGENAFDGILEFAKLAKIYVPYVRLTVVDVIGDDETKKCMELAEKYGLPLHVRHFG